MDQVRQYLKVAAKYHFWILCAIVALLTLGTWYTTSASLSKQFQDNKGKITAADGQITTILSKTEHPNPNFHQQMDLITNKYKDNLRVLWEKQYLEQGKNLRWPEQVIDDRGFITQRGLTHEFVEQVEPLRPIETTVPYDPANKSLDKLKDNFKAEYVNYVKTIALPRLAEIVGAVWEPSLDTGAGNAGGGERFGPGTSLEPTGPKEIVTWNAENQAFLQDTRFDWKKEVGGRPSTLQILYAQEDLWVLETIAKIIAKTNEGADAPHNAVVKRIEYLKLGRDAVGFSGEVLKLAALAGPGPGGPTAPGGPNAPGQPLTPLAPGVDPRAGGPLGAAVALDPAEGRYVDQTYKAIAPDQLRNAFTSTKKEDAFLAVAKRMPVRMHLVIDQRKLHRFLAECGNSNLIVEVRQMRVNRPMYEGGTTSSGGGYPIAGDPSRGGGGGGGRLEGGRPAGGGGRLGGGFPTRGGPSNSGEEEKPHFDIQVELYGIVYIYNPVNEAMVTAVATGDAPPPTETVVTPPVTTPTPPVTTPPDNTPMPPVDSGIPAPMPVEPAPMPVEPAPVEPMPAVPAPAPPVPPTNE